MSRDPSRRVKIALDAMGGDFGPAATVPGALLAAQRGGVEVLLVGDADAVQDTLFGHDPPPFRTILQPPFRRSLKKPLETFSAAG